MPYFRHRSFVFAPASASLSTPMICSSVNRRLFIHLLPDEQTLLHSGTNLGEQTNAVQKEDKVETVFVRRAVSELAHDGERVRLVQPPRLLVEPARRAARRNLQPESLMALRSTSSAPRRAISEASLRRNCSRTVDP